MKLTAFSFLLGVILLACGPGAPKSGTVIQKWYEEAETKTWTHQHQQCITYNKDMQCTGYMYTYHEHEDYDDPDWKVKLEECSYDDSGDRKCRQGVREISQPDWESLEVGDFYGERP